MQKQWLKEAAKGCVAGVCEVRTMPVSDTRPSALCSPQRCPIRTGGSWWIIMLSSELCGINKSLGPEKGSGWAKVSQGQSQGWTLARGQADKDSHRGHAVLGTGIAGLGRFLLMSVMASRWRRPMGSERPGGTHRYADQKVRKGDWEKRQAVSVLQKVQKIYRYLYRYQIAIYLYI